MLKFGDNVFSQYIRRYAGIRGHYVQVHQIYIENSAGFGASLVILLLNVYNRGKSINLGDKDARVGELFKSPRG